jgi:hypothetical protein
VTAKCTESHIKTFPSAKPILMWKTDLFTLKLVAGLVNVLRPFLQLYRRYKSAPVHSPPGVWLHFTAVVPSRVAAYAPSLQTRCSTRASLSLFPPSLSRQVIFMMDGRFSTRTCSPQEDISPVRWKSMHWSSRL